MDTTIHPGRTDLELWNLYKKFRNGNYESGKITAMFLYSTAAMFNILEYAGNCIIDSSHLLSSP